MFFPWFNRYYIKKKIRFFVGFPGFFPLKFPGFCRSFLEGSGSMSVCRFVSAGTGYRPKPEPTTDIFPKRFSALALSVIFQ